MKEDKILVECQCGSEGITVEHFDDEIYLSFWVDTWYAEQKSFLDEILKRLKIAWTILRKGMYLYQEIILTKDEANRLYEYLGKVTEQKSNS
jgi:hypothetical protein